MSYYVQMKATCVNCRIPKSELANLIEYFHLVEIINLKSGRYIKLQLQWEEDAFPITGYFHGDYIHITSVQEGRFLNSSDGGLSYLLKTYKGSGIIVETGEDGEQEQLKYENGVMKKAKVVWE